MKQKIIHVTRTNEQLVEYQRENEGSRWYVMGLNSSLEAMMEIHETFTIMKYELTKTYDCQKALEYLNKLIKRGSKCEVKVIHPKRSLSANNYLHVLFQIWGNHMGYTLDEAKETVKDELQYFYFKNSKHPNANSLTQKFYCKTSKMDSAELAEFTDKFRTWSQATCNYYLCSPEEYLLEQVYFDNLANEKEL